MNFHKTKRIIAIKQHKQLDVIGMCVQNIVVKNQDASGVQIENICPDLRSAALVARSRAARGGSNDKFRQNCNTTQRNMLFYKLNVLLSCKRMKAIIRGSLN